MGGGGTGQRKINRGNKDSPQPLEFDLSAPPTYLVNNHNIAPVAVTFTPKYHRTQLCTGATRTGLVTIVMLHLGGAEENFSFREKCSFGVRAASVRPQPRHDLTRLSSAGLFGPQLRG